MRFFLEMTEQSPVVTRLVCDEAGATAIEYGLIAALIAVAAIAAFQLVGTNLSDLFNPHSPDEAAILSALGAIPV